MRRFSGLCVGGPLAGTVKVHEHTTLSIAINPDLHGIAREEPVPAKATYAKFNYVWDEGITIRSPKIPYQDRKFSFWIPEGNDLEWAIEQLSKAYILRTRQK